MHICRVRPVIVLEGKLVCDATGAHFEQELPTGVKRSAGRFLGTEMTVVPKNEIHESWDGQVFRVLGEVGSEIVEAGFPDRKIRAVQKNVPKFLLALDRCIRSRGSK